MPPPHSHMNKPMDKSYYIALCALGVVCSVLQKTTRYKTPGYDYNLNNCNEWVGKLPVISVRKQRANTTQQINSQEKARKLLGTKLQCSLKRRQKKHLFCCLSSNSVRERIPGFLVQRCGFPSQDAEEAILNRLQNPKSIRQPVI